MRVLISLWVTVPDSLSAGEAEDIAADIEAILEREIPSLLEVEVGDWTEETQ